MNAHNLPTSSLSLGFSGSLAYDRRGNLLTIGSAGSGRAFAYDHENQCVTAGGYNAYNKSDFVYDGKGRLRKRTDYSWDGSSWTPTGETRYVYDGMLLLQERTSAGHPAVTYTRGLDLSGSLEGAGGIGGLLARTAPLTEVARDLLIRELRAGIPYEKLADLVLALHEEDRLCVPQDTAEACEPRIICSLGIANALPPDSRHVQRCIEQATRSLP